MPPRWVRILVFVAAVALALAIVGYALFNTGGSAPGSGTGETLPG